MAGWSFLFVGKRHLYGKGPGEHAEAASSGLPREGLSGDATPQSSVLGRSFLVTMFQKMLRTG